tara:strand:- start:132 stop:752 length:621 start_codon:yes stop_codon:yes gene_type:complete
MNIIHDAITKACPDEDMARIAKRLIDDAVNRKRSAGKFDLYAAFASMPGKEDAIELYDNPTGEKYAFVSLVQIIGAVLCAKYSCLVSESWFLDLEGKTPSEVEEASRWVSQGNPVSQHRDAREGVSVHIETDDVIFDVTITMNSEGLVSNPKAMITRQGGSNYSEGAMVGLRANQQQKAMMVMRPHLMPPTEAIQSLRKDWSLGAN